MQINQSSHRLFAISAILCDFHNSPPSTISSSAPQEGTNTSRPTFKDLLDDDFGYESHESADQNTIGSASPVSADGGLVEPSGVGLPKKVLSSSPKDLGQNKCSVTNAKVAQPMVVIPVMPKINKGSGLLLPKNRNRSEIAEKSQESLPSANGLAGQPFQPLSALSMIHSPLDLLLDPDEIKMEVEEEVIDDHFEVRQSADSHLVIRDKLVMGFGGDYRMSYHIEPVLEINFSSMISKLFHCTVLSSL